MRRSTFLLQKNFGAFWPTEIKLKYWFPIVFSNLARKGIGFFFNARSLFFSLNALYLPTKQPWGAPNFCFWLHPFIRIGHWGWCCWRNLGILYLVSWPYTEVKIGATTFSNLPLWELAKTLNICWLIMTLSSNFLSVIKEVKYGKSSSCILTTQKWNISSY